MAAQARHDNSDAAMHPHALETQTKIEDVFVAHCHRMTLEQQAYTLSRLIDAIHTYPKLIAQERKDPHWPYATDALQTLLSQHQRSFEKLAPIFQAKTTHAASEDILKMAQSFPTESFIKNGKVSKQFIRLVKTHNTGQPQNILLPLWPEDLCTLAACRDISHGFGSNIKQHTIPLYIWEKGSTIAQNKQSSPCVHSDSLPITSSSPPYFITRARLKATADQGAHCVLIHIPTDTGKPLSYTRLETKTSKQIPKDHTFCVIFQEALEEYAQICTSLPLPLEGGPLISR